MALPEPKVSHVGVSGPPFGEMVYLVVRHDGKMIDVAPSRHEASWIIEQCHDANDFRVEYVPAGSVPLTDVTFRFQ